MKKHLLLTLLAVLALSVPAGALEYSMEAPDRDRKSTRLNSSHT